MVYIYIILLKNLEKLSMVAMICVVNSIAFSTTWTMTVGRDPIHIIFSCFYTYSTRVRYNNIKELSLSCMYMCFD